MSSLPKSSAQPTRVLLPVVKRMIQQLDTLFIEYVGPIGAELAHDIFKKWIREGKVSPSATRHYAYALSTQLDNPVESDQFIAKAEQLLLQLQQGAIQ